MQNKEIEEAKERLKYVNMAYDCCNYYSIYDLDCIETLLQYIDQLENKIKESEKGQHTLMQSRRKWKNRYYKERRKRKEADRTVRQIYDDYQDIGNMYFNLDEKRQNIIQQLKTKYERLTQSVKRYEEMRRNCTDEFYLKSYQITIHRLNAKREIISEIIDKLKENDFNSLSKECFKYREVEAKANKYDTLVEKIKKLRQEHINNYNNTNIRKDYWEGSIDTDREILQELLDTEK